jgi:hypothetical protein
MNHAAVSTFGAVALTAAIAVPMAGPANAAVSSHASAAVTQQQAAAAAPAKRFPKPKQLKGYKKAKRWANKPKVKYIRNRESNGRYNINTGNGYYGAYQFSYGTWKAMGGQKYAATADRAPKHIQDYVAYKLYKRAGWSPWGG